MIPVLHPLKLCPRATTPTILSSRGRCRRDGTLRLTLAAVPETRGHSIEANTIGVIRDVAAVTEKQQFLVIRLATKGTGLEIRKIIIDIVCDHRRIDVWNLDPVLDGVG